MKKPQKAAAPAAEVRELNAVNWAVTNPFALIMAGLLTMWGGAAVGQVVAPTLALFVLAVLLALLTVIDIKHGILPHALTGTLVALGVMLAPIFGRGYGEALMAGGLAFGGLLLCAGLTRLATGKEALGGGDLWLVLGLGVWMGAAALPMFVMMVAVLGALSVALKRWLTQGYPVLTEHEAQRFAFGPALCGAGWLAVLYGDAYWRAIDMLMLLAA